VNEATRLVLEPGRTVLRRGAASHELRLGADGIARSFQSDLPLPRELERAIDLLEDELARVPRPLHGPATLASGDARLLGWAGGAALLSREEIEALFQRLSSAALGDPSALRGLPRDRDAAAALLVVRELLHHLGYAELRITRG
jgi:exopolyphosphatase/pppGpp-phosphohydrolase